MTYLYDEYKDRFQKYFDGVKPINDKHNEVNQLKYHHTFRVVSEIKKLCELFKLTQEETELAELIALFHDVGRFEQYARYQTFSDKDSEDHAELAIQVIEENKLLEGLKRQDFELVKLAILNHNKLAISGNLSEEHVFFTKLIRDADKLDILYVVTNKEKYFVPDDVKKNSAKLNPVFVGNIRNHELVSYADVKEMLDYALLRISWVFDLNFEYTVLQFKERGYFEKMLEQLPDSAEKNEIRVVIEEYISRILLSISSGARLKSI